MHSKRPDRLTLLRPYRDGRLLVVMGRASGLPPAAIALGPRVDADTAHARPDGCEANLHRGANRAGDPRGQRHPRATSALQVRSDSESATPPGRQSNLRVDDAPSPRHTCAVGEGCRPAPNRPGHLRAALPSGATCACSSVVNGNLRGAKESRSFKPMVEGSIPSRRIPTVAGD